MTFQVDSTGLGQRAHLPLFPGYSFRTILACEQAHCLRKGWENRGGREVKGCLPSPRNFFTLSLNREPVHRSKFSKISGILCHPIDVLQNVFSGDGYKRSVQPLKWSRPRNDTQTLNDPKLDPEMIPTLKWSPTLFTPTRKWSPINLYRTSLVFACPRYPW